MLLLVGAVAVLLASAWQPLGLGGTVSRWWAVAQGPDDRPAVEADAATTHPDPNPAPPPEPGPPRLLSGRAGNAQSGPVGSVLPVPLQLQVLDAVGVGVPGVEVEFVTVTGEATLDPARVRSGEGGMAATTVALPAAPQDIQILARLPDVDGVETRFVLSAVPATGAAFGGFDGSDQTGAPDERLPEA